MRRSSRPPRSIGWLSASRGCGRRGRQSLRPRQERRGAALQWVADKKKRAEKIPGGEGRIGGRGESGRGGQGQSSRPRPRSGDKPEGRKKPGKPAAPPSSEEPDPKAQKNFTDPESLIMKIQRTAFIQGYNAQAAVDATAQVIVAHRPRREGRASSDTQLAPIPRRHRSQSGQEPRRLSAGTRAIVFSDADNLAAMEG